MGVDEVVPPSLTMSTEYLLNRFDSSKYPEFSFPPSTAAWVSAILSLCPMYTIPRTILYVYPTAPQNSPITSSGVLPLVVADVPIRVPAGSGYPPFVIRLSAYIFDPGNGGGDTNMYGTGR